MCNPVQGNKITDGGHVTCDIVNIMVNISLVVIQYYIFHSHPLELIMGKKRKFFPPNKNIRNIRLFNRIRTGGYLLTLLHLSHFKACLSEHLYKVSLHKVKQSVYEIVQWSTNSCQIFTFQGDLSQECPFCHIFFKINYPDRYTAD